MDEVTKLISENRLLREENAILRMLVGSTRKIEDPRVASQVEVNRQRALQLKLELSNALHAGMNVRLLEYGHEAASEALDSL